MATGQVEVATTEYEVCVSYEMWTEASREAGEAAERGWKVEREVMEADELAKLARELGISAASTSAPTPQTLFISETPDEDRAHFERGEDRYYALQVQTVDGYAPSAEDMQRIAALIGVSFRQPLELQEEAEDAAEEVLGYYVNLDERGSFYADVRQADGKTVFEVRAGNELGEDESNPVDDGFMKHLRDVDGLTQYLRSIKVIDQDARVLEMHAFEAAMEKRQPAAKGPSL